MRTGFAARRAGALPHLCVEGGVLVERSNAPISGLPDQIALDACGLQISQDLTDPGVLRTGGVSATHRDEGTGVPPVAQSFESARSPFAEYSAAPRGGMLAYSS